MPLEATSPVEALPPSVGVQLLAAVAAREVDMPSSFDVDDALTALKDPMCQASDACLAQVAHATRAGWTLAVSASQRAAVWVLGARVVKADGAEVRRREPLPVNAGPDGALDWAQAFRSLLDALALESLGQPEDTPAVATPSPAARPAPPPAPAPSPSVAAAPVVVRTPPKASWRTPAALTAAGLALASGGAAASLGLMNLAEANALRQASAGGVLPAAQLERAAAFDERTTAAVALGIGAGVAAAVAVTVWATGRDDGPVLVPSAGPAGGGVSLVGRWP